VVSIAAAFAALACSSAPLHAAPYPGHAPGLGRLPWVSGSPASVGLVGLVWYWPKAWTAAGYRTARIYTGGTTPGTKTGPNMKILWAFLSAPAKRAYAHSSATTLVVKGTRLDGLGRTWQRFAPIGYAGEDGAPSWASIIDLPTPGCWRLRLTSGPLRATVVFLVSR
jgi:hypothetical protein